MIKLYKHIGKRGVVVVKAMDESQAIELIRDALELLGLQEEDIDLPVEIIDVNEGPGVLFMMKKK